MTETCIIPDCTVRGAHESDCQGGDCKGCKPRLVAIGHLCQWHMNRITWAVAAHNELIEHLHEIGKPYAHAAPLSPDVSGRHDPAEDTVLPAPWIASDELAADLAGWAHAYLDDAAEEERWPNREPWNGDVAWWVSDHLKPIAGTEWVGEFVTSYLRDVETLHHRWPTVADVEPAHKVKVPCPRCGLMSLLYTPPRLPRQPFVVECTDPDCARRFSEDEWERFEALAMREAGA